MIHDRSRARWRLPYLLVAVTALAQATARAQEPGSMPFTVTGIRVEGLQRISEGTLFNTLPVNIGDVLDARRVREALRAVHTTGFFDDVEMRREDSGVLVVVVQERPTIRAFEVTGNKDIKSEDLLKSLRNVGLASGKFFSRSTLEDVRQFLTEQYFSRGRYAVRVEPTIEEVGGNLVDVRVEIVEGKRSRIRDINVVGNKAFSDRELLAAL
jgi:outer membrane protein insertion porin family